MRFTVTWSSEADADLARRWLTLGPDEQRHLSLCIDHIDAALRQNAHQKGALLRGHEPLRFYAAPPFLGQPAVGVVYEVSAEDRLVRVLELWILDGPSDVVATSN